MAQHSDGSWYSRIHKWVARNKSKVGKCSECGTEGFTEWANVSGEYRRDLDDYVEVCRPCHRSMDDTGECVNGHAMTEENTYTAPATGHRSCRTCRRDAKARRLQRARGCLSS